MKSHAAALCVVSVLLAGCNAPQSPVADEAKAPTPQAQPELPPAVAMPEPLPEPVVDATAGAFRALGTEPFWHLDIDGGALVYKTPEDQVGQMLTGSRTAVAGGIDIAGEHAGQPFELSLRSGDCSDGMSDTRYPMTARFEIEGRSLAGCAQPAE